MLVSYTAYLKVSRCSKNRAGCFHISGLCKVSWFISLGNTQISGYINSGLITCGETNIFMCTVIFVLEIEACVYNIS